MNSLVNWVSKKFSKAYNTAATTILARILSMVIDQQDENAMKLELFNDWSMKLILKKVFLKTDLINNSIDFITLDSVYISDFSFKGAYNLSKHLCKIETVVVELALHNDLEASVHETELTASIQNFREKMPIEKHVSIAEWLLHYVESVKLQIERFTAIIKTDQDSPITIEIHNFNFTINHPNSALFSGTVDSISVFYGSKLAKKQVAQLLKISFFATLESIVINFNDNDATIDETVLRHIQFIIKFILQFIDQNVSPSKQVVTVNFKNIHAKLEEFDFNVKDVEVLVKENNVDVTVSKLNSNLVNFTQPLFINVNLPVNGRYSILGPCRIDNIQDWEKKVFGLNIIKVKVITPEVFTPDTKCELKLEKFNKMIKTFRMFELLAIDSDEPSLPVAVSVYVTKAKLKMDDLLLETEKLQIGVFLFLEKNVEIQVNVLGQTVYSELNGTLLAQSIPKQSDFSVVVKLGEKINVDTFLTNFVIAFPRIESLNYITRFVEEMLKISEENAGEELETVVKINIHNIFIDYMTFKMPSRAIAQLMEGKVNLSLKDSELNGSAVLAVAAYLSNMRQPLSLFSLQSPQLLSRCGFAQILKGVVNDLSFSLSKDQKFTLTANHATFAAGLCSDSFNLLLSVYAHILYGLEYGDAQIYIPQPKPKIDIKEELMESMRQSFIEMKPTNNENVSSETIKTFSPESSEIQLEKPSHDPDVQILINDCNVSVLFYGGYDFEKIFDLRILEKSPPFNLDDASDDFDFVLTRNENPSLEIDSVLSVSVGVFSGDDINTRIVANSKYFDVIDHIPDSKARLMIGLEQSDREIGVLFDILSSGAFRLSLELPSIGVFLTQNQIDFLLDFFDRTIPLFDADKSETPLKFDFFCIKGSSLLINAHFSYILSVSIEDISINLPMCILSSISDKNELIARLSEFYFDSLAWSAFSVAGGLPVLSNFKRIGKAVYNLFRHFGGKSFKVLMKTLATEALNAGTCATSLTETLLGFAVEAGAGDEDWRRSPIASLVVTHRIGAIPNIVLMPGLKLASEATKMLRYVKDKVNPNARQDRKREKIPIK